MVKGNESFKQVIQSYLEQRAKSDSLFAVSFAKSGKKIDECCDYIIGEARKRGGTVVCMSDDEVFGLAVHYYDEDNIMPTNRMATVGKLVGLSEKEQHALPKRKTSKKKDNDDVKQMTLF